jgi:hypothetical protein
MMNHVKSFQVSASIIWPCLRIGNFNPWLLSSQPPQKTCWIHHFHSNLKYHIVG